MVKQIYTRTFNILMKMPVKLWGLSLLVSVISMLIALLCGIPIVVIPVTLTLSASMAAVYLDGYNGKEVYSEQMFAGFKNFLHVAGGMCWRMLWIFLWCLIPIAGPFIAIYKAFSYAFTPYILMNENETGATEALKSSMERTKGYKGSMFVAMIIPIVAYILVSAILGLLALIPFVGVVFTAVSVIVTLIFSLFAPLFFGLVSAGFYDHVKSSEYRASVTPAADAPKTPCEVCGHENVVGTKFCGKCGSKID